MRRLPLVPHITNTHRSAMRMIGELSQGVDQPESAVDEGPIRRRRHRYQVYRHDGSDLDHLGGVGGRPVTYAPASGTFQASYSYTQSPLPAVFSHSLDREPRWIRAVRSLRVCSYPARAAATPA